MQFARDVKSFALALIALWGSVAFAGSVPADARAETPIQMHWAVQIPMRDGQHLNATIYRPRNQQGRLPVVLTITPYVGDRFHSVGTYFARHGYVFAIVDSRGRGNSEGVFRPFKDDGPDGYDAVEWLADQPYADGQVAMWGGSYGGMNQWAIAALAPPSLKSIVPASASLAGFDFPRVKQVYQPYMEKWIGLVAGRSANNNWFGDRAYWNDIYQRLVREGLPLRAVDSLAGNPNAIVQEWLDHPAADAYWQALSPSAAQYRAIGIPTLTIVGHYDADQAGALEHYRRHAQNTEDGGARDYLLIGPWDHGGTREPRRNVGGLDFGAESVIDMLGLHVAWYDWTMKGAARPAFLRDRVTWYTVGPNSWSHSSALATVPTKPLTLYMSAADRAATSVDTAGKLTAKKPGGEKPRVYRYDPLNRERADLEREGSKSDDGLIDDRDVRRLRGDGLIYESPAFESGTTIAGRPELTMYLSTNVPDTDVTASLYVLRADGSSVQLGSDLVRLRWRESPSKEKFMTPGKIERVQLLDFPWVSRRLEQGERLRLVIAPAGASVTWEHHYNSDEPVAEQTAKDAKVALVSLHAGAGHASEISVPVLQTEPPAAIPRAAVGSTTRAAQFMPKELTKLAPNAGVRPQWAGNETFWYVDRSSPEATLVIGQVASRETSRIEISKLKMPDGTAALSERDLGNGRVLSATREVVALELPGRRVQCELNSLACRLIGPVGNWGSARAPDGLALAEARDGPLLIRDGQGERIIPVKAPETRWSLEPGSNNSSVTDRRQGTVATVGAWAPDSSVFLTHTIDEHRVRLLQLLHAAPPGGVMPAVYQYHFPMACDAELPEFTFNLISRDGSVRSIDLPPQRISYIDPITTKDAWWSADGKRIYIVLYNRTYTSASLHEIDPRDGSVKQLLQEETDYPINPVYAFGFESDVRVHGDEIIWPSQRAGTNALYLYTKGGRLKRALTPPTQTVRRVLHVDYEQRVIRYSANGGEGGDPYLRYIYSVGFDGGSPRLLTPETADHEVVFSDDGRYMLDAYARIDLPTKVVLRKLDGSIVRTVLQESDQALRAIGWRPPEPFTVKARDGKTDLHGVMFLPSDYDPAKKYPLLEMSYPGPQTATVPKRFEQVLSSRAGAAPSLAELGFMVMMLDGMGKPYRSLDFSRVGWYHLDDAGIPDSLTALDQLAGRFPIDRSRVGIYGNSAGGYAATRALITHPEVYRAAFSMSGDHDLQHYAATWFERFQGGCPASGEAPRALFDRVSNIPLAGSLRGALLLGYGELDDNVHPLNTLRMARALRAAGKSFEMLMVPDANHGAMEDDMTYRALWDFFIRNVRDVH